MGRKLFIFLGVVLGIAAVLAIVVSMQPGDFRVTRSATMAASPEVVYAQVSDFQKWGAWSPWEKLDPDMKRTFEGPPSGKGAIYAWKGNKEVGEGRMTITDAKTNEEVLINLEFKEPMAATCDTQFTLKPQNEKTLVTWTMSGKNNFIAKAMHLFMNMDKMIGADFEKGLASMKEVVEAPAKK